MWLLLFSISANREVAKSVFFVVHTKSVESIARFGELNRRRKILLYTQEKKIYTYSRIEICQRWYTKFLMFLKTWNSSPLGEKFLTCYVHNPDWPLRVPKSCSLAVCLHLYSLLYDVITFFVALFLSARAIMVKINKWMIIFN